MLRIAAMKYGFCALQQKSVVLLSAYFANAVRIGSFAISYSNLAFANCQYKNSSYYYIVRKVLIYEEND